MAGKYQRKPAPGKRRVNVLLIALLAALVLLLVLAGVYVWILMDQVQYNPGESTLSSSDMNEILKPSTDGATQDPTGETVQVIHPTEVTWPTGPATELMNKDVLTILLIGQDRRPGEKIARSDTMILVTLNQKTGVMTLTSLMRDLYVPIPGFKDPNRINVSYSTGGMARLKETIRQNFGVVVDGCLEVDFDGFVDLVELMGGVEMELTEEEAVHLNNYEDFYGFPEESWNLQPGVNMLTGKQALSYARIRMVGGTADFGRTERQRKVIGAMLKKFMSLSIPQMSDLLMTGAGMVTTDMSRSDLLGCAFSVMPMLGDLQLETMRIPSNDGYYEADVEGIGRVLVPYLEKARSQLAKLYQ